MNSESDTRTALVKLATVVNRIANINNDDTLRDKWSDITPLELLDNLEPIEAHISNQHVLHMLLLTREYYTS